MAASLAVQLVWAGAQPGAAAQEQAAPIVQRAPVIPCGGAVLARGRLGRVLDGRNFVLDDGRAVHLAGIEVPLPTGPGAQNARSGVPAKAALAVLLDAADIELRQGDLAFDRYGRMVAYGEVFRDGSQRSVQAALVSAGLARVGADVQNEACALELLRRESAARGAKLGLWADPHYRPLPADDSAGILERRGHFALIEGKVLSVHESGAAVYVNFGRHWSEDFAVAIRRRDAGRFAAAGVDLNGLFRRSVLVRGWVQAHDGGSRLGSGTAGWRAPWIEAEYPEQIEPAGQ